MTFKMERSGKVLTNRGGWLCLLIPLVLLFNPFLALPHLSQGDGLFHPPSYRATVASAELLQFRGVEYPAIAIVLAICTLFTLTGLLNPIATSLRPIAIADAASPADPLVPGSIWFRPPPAA